MPAANAVPGFLPSVHGLHFANRWPAGPTLTVGPLDPRWIGIGDASAGLCGGMAWFVRERFAAGLPISPDTAPPANGSPLFRAIVRRQVQSLDWFRGPLRYWWMAGRGAARAQRRSLDAELPQILRSIDAGQPALTGLVRHDGWNPWHLSRSHQVLAYAYAVDPERGSTTLRVYDPNWPDRDDITITLSPTGFRQSTGEPLFGVLALA
jgi:hypothetical protein